MKNLIFIILMCSVFVANLFGGDLSENAKFVVSLPVLTYESRMGEMYEDVDGSGQEYLDFFLGAYELGIEYVVMNGLAIGGTIGYQSYWWGDIKNEKRTIGPSVRYYLELGKFLPYAGGSYVFERYNDDNGTTSVDYNYNYINLGGGLVYHLSARFATYCEFSYSIVSAEPDNGSSSTGDIVAGAFGLKAFF